MSNVKGKGQRLIPEELLRYLEALKNKYPVAVDLIEANPTLEGGEDSLSSVLINGTKYAVGGSGGATLDDIVDSHDNKRFIEGEGVPTTSITGIDFLYNKWSLSGTHLMIVVVIKATTSVTINANTYLASFTLPDYIFNKIVPISDDVVDYKTFNIYDNIGTVVTTCNGFIRKLSNALNLKSGYSTTISLSSGKCIRFQFDLLIDSE